jgi:hypothetical protein
MWNNVVFKASFERVKKYGKGPFATYHMNENLGFLPTNEGIMHVNDNHTLVIEKEMTGPDFANLLHDISKYVQEEPVLWKNKPKSLLLTASFAVSQSMTAKQANEQPRELVEATACHLPATELADFLKLNKYMYGLREYFSIDGLQKFLFHFFKTYQRSDLKPHTKAELKRAKKSIKWAVFDMTRQNLKSSKKLDWAFSFLGLMKQLDQFDAQCLFEYRFFALKSRYNKQYVRFPVPDVLFPLSRIVPEKDYSESDLPELDEDYEKHEREFKAPLELRDQFFTLMCGMEEAMWRGSYHEVFAYAAHLLCEEKFVTNVELQKYFLFVWGNLAMCLAKLHIPELFSLSCLDKMKPCCFAQQIDVLYTKQVVMAAYEQYDEEEKLMLEMLEIVPTYSAYFRKMIQTHMSAVQKKIEDMLMQDFASLREWHKTKNDDLDNELRRLEKAIMEECDKHIKLMHVLCTITKSRAFCEEYEVQIHIMKLYKQIRYCFRHEWKEEDEFYPILCCIHNHISMTWNYKIKVDSFEEYHQQMLDLKRELQKQTRMLYPKVWADVCYFHLLFLKALRDPEPTIFSQMLYDDALYIYSNIDHPRASRLEKLYKNGHVLEEPKFENKINPQCSIIWLAQKAPRVKGLIRHGISSAKKFDLWDADSYWTANK